LSEKKTISPLIPAHELLELYSSEYLILIDAGTGNNAQTNYQKKHLDGALFVDVNTQLADIKDDFSNGGRHPLPSTKQFSETLSSLGISPQSHVVIYDNKNGANAAARFWWMLKAVGHEKVQVLNGGMEEAVKFNFPTSSKIEKVKKVETYKTSSWQLPRATMDEVEKVSQKDNYCIIDVREEVRYQGISEPIDLIAGHIPGAINIPFSRNLNNDGLFLAEKELFQIYSKIIDRVSSKRTIVYCGSGVTACHTLLAIAYAGFEIPKLYVGSWSEWSRNNKTIEVKVNPSI